MKFILMLFLVSLSSYSQYFSASVTNSALTKVIGSALETYSESSQEVRFTIPASTSHLMLTHKDINKFPIVNEIKKYVNIDLSKDFHYYLKWSPMTVTFKLKDKYDFDFKGNSKDFTLFAKGIVESITVDADRFEICETKNRRCIKNKGVYVDIRNFKIDLSEDDFIEAIVALNIKNDNTKTLVSNSGLYSSLFIPKNRSGKAIAKRFNLKQKETKIDINFREILIPTPTLKVGDRVVELDTSGLKKCLIANKEILAGELLHIVGKFITEDLAKTVTSGIIGNLQEITKKIGIFNFKTDAMIGPRLYEDSYDQVTPFFMSQKDKSDISSSLLNSLREMIYYANIDLEYLMLRPFHNELLVFDYDMDFTLNNEVANFEKSILNGKGLFSLPNFDSLKNDYDIALAIGEPFFNGLLDLMTKTGIVNEIFEEKAKVDGLQINSIRVHFDQMINANFSKKKNYTEKIEDTIVVDNTRIALDKRRIPRLRKMPIDQSRSYNTGEFTLVANVKLDLSKQNAEGLSKKFENFVASTLEDKIVWFPLELRFRPVYKRINGRSFISLKLNLDFFDNGLPNNYGYPKKNMFDIVEKGIAKTIKGILSKSFANEVLMDVTDHLSIDGLCADPVGLTFLNSGHIVLKLKVEDLKLKNLVNFIGGK